MNPRNDGRHFQQMENFIWPMLNLQTHYNKKNTKNLRNENSTKTNAVLFLSFLAVLQSSLSKKDKMRELTTGDTK